MSEFIRFNEDEIDFLFIFILVSFKFTSKSVSLAQAKKETMMIVKFTLDLFCCHP